MRLRMLSTQRGAEDGFSLSTYEKGREYEIGGTHRADDLAAVFLREGWAEPVVVGPVLLGVPALVVGNDEAAIKPTAEVVVEIPAPLSPQVPAHRRRR
jgi:hypothetical protein